LGEHADALAQHIPVLFFEELANKCRQIHSGLRHRVNTSVFLLPPERTHGKMRDGDCACLGRRRCRIYTTSRDSNDGSGVAPSARIVTLNTTAVSDAPQET